MKFAHKHTQHKRTSIEHANDYSQFQILSFLVFYFPETGQIWTYTMAKRNSEAMVSYFRNSQNHPWWSSFFLKLLAQYRSSLSEVFLAKGVLKICRKFTGEHPCRSMILIKLLYIFIEITLQHRFSPVNLLHIFRTCFYKNTSGWLLLHNIFRYIETEKEVDGKSYLESSIIFDRSPFFFIVPALSWFLSLYSMFNRQQVTE